MADAAGRGRTSARYQVGGAADPACRVPPARARHERLTAAPPQGLCLTAAPPHKSPPLPHRRRLRDASLSLCQLADSADDRHRAHHRTPTPARCRGFMSYRRHVRVILYSRYRESSKMGYLSLSIGRRGGAMLRGRLAHGVVPSRTMHSVALLHCLKAASNRLTSPPAPARSGPRRVVEARADTRSTRRRGPPRGVCLPSPDPSPARTSPRPSMGSCTRRLPPPSRALHHRAPPRAGTVHTPRSHRAHAVSSPCPRTPCTALTESSDAAKPARVSGDTLAPCQVQSDGALAELLLPWL